MSDEKIALLRSYGAEVVVCPTAVPPEDPRSYYSTAERLVRETPGAFRPDQYSNPANPLAHELTTGPEIWRQTDDRLVIAVPERRVLLDDVRPRARPCLQVRLEHLVRGAREDVVGAEQVELLLGAAFLRIMYSAAG